MLLYGGISNENEKDAEPGAPDGAVQRLPDCRARLPARSLALPETGLHRPLGGGRLRQGQIHRRDGPAEPGRELKKATKKAVNNIRE